MYQIDEFARLAEQLGCKVRRDEPMSRHTTFKIGGPADLFITVYSQEAVSELFRCAHELAFPLLPIGKGSNMLVNDGGIRGAVVALGGDFRQISLKEPDVIQCGAGASLADVCFFAKEHSLTGLECAWGIPGAAGGAAFMNAGAYNWEMKNVLTACTHVTKSGEIGTLSGQDLQLGYRRSAYTDNGFTILSLTLQLQKGDKELIAAAMDDLYHRRKSKQPLEFPSAGSVFKRPEGNFAGSLIEQCGLKGRTVGGAMVSPKHAGFIVNAGGATCKDVLELIDIIKNTVYQQTNITLECEIKSLG
jgi:UDP-N-acetylmuramate dehydrogenase